MRKNAIIFLIVMIVTLSGCAKTYTIQQPENTGERKEKTKEKIKEKIKEDILPGHEENLFQYSIKINEDTLTFPMSLAELADLGYDTTDNLTEELLPQEVNAEKLFTKGKVSFCVQLYNSTADIQKMEQCKVGGIIISAASQSRDETSITLPNDIVLGVSTEADIRKAYGSPSDMVEEKSELELSYEENRYAAARLSVDQKTKYLTALDIHNFSMDAVNVEIADKNTLPYSAPGEIGLDLLSGIVLFEGVLYQLPVPVSEFAGSGFEIEGKSADEVINADSTGQITLKKNDKTLLALIKNPTSEGRLATDCLVTTLFSDTENNKFDLVLPKDITIGMSEKTLLKQLVDYEYEKKVTDQTTCYILTKEKLSLEILVDVSSEKIIKLYLSSN